jgi:hypothetical protein
VKHNIIVAHRSKFARLAGIDYAKHSPGTIRFIPPAYMIKEFEIDYRRMQENMIYGESLPFDELIEQLKILQSKINAIEWT